MFLIKVTDFRSEAPKLREHIWTSVVKLSPPKYVKQTADLFLKRVELNPQARVDLTAKEKCVFLYNSIFPHGRPIFEVYIQTVS